MVQFYTFFHQLTASPRHEIALFFAQFIASGTPFRYNCNEICSFYHEFGTKMALSGAILQPGTRMWALHARNYGGLVCEVSFVFTQNRSKNALCWLHQSWGAAPMTTICNGWACMSALSLQYVRWQHRHAWSGFFVFGTDHGESPGPFFRTPHLHTHGLVNDSLCRVVIPV